MLLDFIFFLFKFSFLFLTDPLKRDKWPNEILLVLFILNMTNLEAYNIRLFIYFSLFGF